MVVAHKSWSTFLAMGVSVCWPPSWSCLDHLVMRVGNLWIMGGSWALSRTWIRDTAFWSKKPVLAMLSWRSNQMSYHRKLTASKQYFLSFRGCFIDASWTHTSKKTAFVRADRSGWDSSISAEDGMPELQISKYFERHPEWWQGPM